MRKALARIEQLKGKMPRAAALDDVSLGHRARGRQLHHKAPRRNDDEPPQGGFGGPQHAKHGAVKRARNPRHRSTAQHDEQGRDDGLEGFAVAFDGSDPVHGGFLV
jgi:hypothetical protein